MRCPSTRGRGERRKLLCPVGEVLPLIAAAKNSGPAMNAKATSPNPKTDGSTPARSEHTTTVQPSRPKATADAVRDTALWRRLDCLGRGCIGGKRRNRMTRYFSFELDLERTETKQRSPLILGMPAQRSTPITSCQAWTPGCHSEYRH